MQTKQHKGKCAREVAPMHEWRGTKGEQRTGGARLPERTRTGSEGERKYGIHTAACRRRGDVWVRPLGTATYANSSSSGETTTPRPNHQLSTPNSELPPPNSHRQPSNSGLQMENPRRRTCNPERQNPQPRIQNAKRQTTTPNAKRRIEIARESAPRCNGASAQRERTRTQKRCITPTLRNVQTAGTHQIARTVNG